MSSPVASLQRTNNVLQIKLNNNGSFDAFNYSPGQDRNIRWLSRPSQRSLQNYFRDTEKFRVTFNVENFQPEQIKIYIQNHQLTVTGIYEERTEGRYTQKQFEKSFEIPVNADIEAMASYITPADMLVVEIPLNSNAQQPSTYMNHLNVDNSLNDQRRLSFSLSKFNALNNQELLSPTNNSPNLPVQGQQVRRTSITKTTTTTTSTGTTGLSPEATELLRSADMSASTTQGYDRRLAERSITNTTNQQIKINQPNSPASSSSTIKKTKNSTLTNFADLPIKIPPELLATGGTITIQKRKVSVTKTVDPSGTHPAPMPVTKSHVQKSITNERRNSKTISTNNQRRTFTLDEFLQNKMWNPMIVNGFDGKKILHMRLQIKPGTRADQIKVTLDGFDLRVGVENEIVVNVSQRMNEQSYRQITLFPTCEIDKLKTEFKSDGFLHIQVPIKI